MKHYAAIIKNPAWDAQDIEQCKIVLAYKIAYMIDVDIDAVRRDVHYDEIRDSAGDVCIRAMFEERRELRVVRVQ